MKKIRARRSISRQSLRQKEIDNCKALLRAILKIERGDRCEICGRIGDVGLFHIISCGSQPRLQLCRINILLSCWRPCHEKWHHDMNYARKVVEPEVIRLRGENYRNDILKYKVTAPKLSLFYLKTLAEALKIELKQLEG